MIRARQVRLVGRLLARVAMAFGDLDRPLIAQIVPIRRCNLACGYCTEFDHTSAPVPIALMNARIDRLAELRTAVVTISGGEPLLHPDLDSMIERIRRRGMIATLISNAYLLTPERAARLDAAGLEHLQISIDNVEPDDVSKKSLRLLEGKLAWLARHARFAVNINSVLGSGVARPSDALVIARRARELGFTSSLGLLNGHGAEIGLWAEEMAVFGEVSRCGDWTRLASDTWQTNVAAGRPNDWRCRAGARYLYVDEFGLVHYCSQQRGAPAIPLAQYGREEIRKAFHTHKACAPFCTINCVQQASLLDRWRAPQGEPAPMSCCAPPPRPRQSRGPSWNF